MSYLSEAIEDEWAAVQNVLSQRDFKIYPGALISLENLAPWPSDRSFDEFLNFAETSERRIIYAVAQKFEPEDAL